MPDTNDIFYSRDTGSGWIRESLTTNGGPNRFSSLVLDAQDHPRVSFIGWNSADVQYGAYDGSDWTFETVAAGQGWSFTGLAFDAAGAPMVAYYKYLSEAGLYIARKQGGVWSRLLLDAGADCGLHLSFALDGYGRAHIAYFDKTRKQIRYLCWLE
jgi:uncharacterized protein YfiM (DUF2279 family)